jgi:hypothetical protein
MPEAMSGQRGQALVGVMVAMLVLFALAGAVAIGASTLLTNRGHSDVTNDDFQVHSAVNDSIAQVNGQPLRCGAPPPLPSPVPTPSPTSTPSPLTLDQVPSRPQAQCARQDDAVLTSVQRYEPGAGCAKVALGSGGRLAVLFDARTTAAGWAYLDTSPADAACDPPPPTTPTPPCLKRWFSGGSGIRQVALTCDFAATDRVFLHMNVSEPGPAHVFAASRDDRGQPAAVGYLVLVASGTGVAKPDVEESLYFMSRDGTVRHQLFEAPLP